MSHLLREVRDGIANSKEETQYMNPISPKAWILIRLAQWAALFLGTDCMGTSRHDLNAASTIIIAVLFVAQASICLFLFIAKPPR